jgi:tetratricopeptide (TPR) repeat protein
VNNLGSKGKYHEAIEELNKGAALAPENTILLFNLGYYYNMVGKKDAAIDAFQKIVSINPHDSLAIKCASFIEILKKAP